MLYNINNKLGDLMRCSDSIDILNHIDNYIRRWKLWKFLLFNWRWRILIEYAWNYLLKWSYADRIYRNIIFMTNVI